MRFRQLLQHFTHARGVTLDDVRLLVGGHGIGDVLVALRGQFRVVLDYGQHARPISARLLAFSLAASLQIGFVFPGRRY